MAFSQESQNLIKTNRKAEIRCTITGMHDGMLFFVTGNKGAEKSDSIEMSQVAAITTTTSSLENKNAFKNEMFNRDGKGTLSEVDKKYMDVKVLLVAEVSRARGKNLLITGTIMFGSSLVLLSTGSGLLFWPGDKAAAASVSCFYVGSHLFIPGIVMLPIGAIKLGRAKVYYKQIGNYSTGEITMMPSSIVLPRAMGGIAPGATLQFTF